MSRQEVLALPVRTFWFLNEQIDRIAAEEALRGIDLALAGNMNAEGLKELMQRLKRQMGLVMKIDESPDLAGLQRIATMNKVR